MSDEKKMPAGVLEGINSLLNSLYTLFLLRDVCGKIAPGLVLLLSLWLLQTPAGGQVKLPDGFSVPAWVLLLGVAWLAGLSMQGVGEQLRILKRAGDEPDWEKLRVEFRQLGHQVHQHDFERQVVVKEAAGNAAVALALSFLLLGTRVVFVPAPADRLGAWLCAVVVVIAIVGLWCIHRSAFEQAKKYMSELIALRKRESSQGAGAAQQ